MIQQYDEARAHRIQDHIYELQLVTDMKSIPEETLQSHVKRWQWVRWNQQDYPHIMDPAMLAIFELRKRKIPLLLPVPVFLLVVDTRRKTNGSLA